LFLPQTPNDFSDTKEKSGSAAIFTFERLNSAVMDFSLLRYRLSVKKSLHSLQLRQKEAQ
jgi:hypothetical protein